MIIIIINMIFLLCLIIIIIFISAALILEEIAIDSHDKDIETKYLQEAHDLHQSSLNLARQAFGEFNVQTAKHYGNLGRLYQSMRKFKVGTAVSVFHITLCLIITFVS